MIIIKKIDKYDCDKRVHKVGFAQQIYIVTFLIFTQ